jgi:hypothetical protein
MRRMMNDCETQKNGKNTPSRFFRSKTIPDNQTFAMQVRLICNDKSTQLDHNYEIYELQMIRVKLSSLIIVNDKVSLPSQSKAGV